MSRRPRSVLEMRSARDAAPEALDSKLKRNGTRKAEQRPGDCSSRK